MTTIYGIKNCDTIKKACLWLTSHNIDYRFHDFRATGLTAQTLQAWADKVGWQTLLNKRSTSWKQLDASIRDNINAETAFSAMLNNPTLIKRPVLTSADKIQVGFTADQYQHFFRSLQDKD